VGGVGIKFIVEPKDTIVPTGGSGVLNCAARGEGQPKISWKKDGSLISFVGDTRRSVNLILYKQNMFISLFKFLVLYLTNRLRLTNTYSTVN